MRLLHFLIGAMVLITTGCAQDSEGIYNGASQYRDEIFLADPTILREGDMYYLTGTGNQQQQGFVLLESADLKSWHTVENNEFVLKKGDQTYGTEGFWAPQWFKAQDRYRQRTNRNGICRLLERPFPPDRYKADRQKPEEYRPLPVPR